MERNSCGCRLTGYNLVFSCSGAADVGALADQAARRLSQEKVAAMNCIAAIAARIPGYLDTARNSTGILAIDGCANGCTKRILEDAGFHEYTHLQLGDLGFKKGSSQPTEDACRQVFQHACSLIADRPGGEQG